MSCILCGASQKLVETERGRDSVLQPNPCVMLRRLQLPVKDRKRSPVRYEDAMGIHIQQAAEACCRLNWDLDYEAIRVA